MKIREILLVEDNPGDAALVREALGTLAVPHRLVVVRDGRAGLKWLRSPKTAPESIHPDLILLDLNLPIMDGRELLAEIKSDPNLKHIPLVVLTSSEAPSDILRCYALHANSYISKPSDFETLLQVAKVTLDYWFGVVKLPD